MPTFLCDYTLKDNVPTPYNLMVEGYKFITIVGKAGAGKTSILLALFRDKRILRKTFNNIILVIPRHSLNSLDKKSNIFKDLADDKQFDSIDSIDIIREKIKSYAEEGENTALIIDDQTSKLKDSYISSVLSDIIFNRRHYRVSIFLLVQIYERIPLQIRKNINLLLVLFKPSIKEVNKIVEESIEYKEDTAQEIMKIAFKKPYDKLLIDLVSQRVFSNCNEIIINEN